VCDLNHFNLSSAICQLKNSQVALFLRCAPIWRSISAIVALAAGQSVIITSKSSGWNRSILNIWCFGSRQWCSQLAKVTGERPATARSQFPAETQPLLRTISQDDWRDPAKADA
jgi:hypothetical protein